MMNTSLLGLQFYMTILHFQYGLEKIRQARSSPKFFSRGSYSTTINVQINSVNCKTVYIGSNLQKNHRTYAHTKLTYYTFQSLERKFSAKM